MSLLNTDYNYQEMNKELVGEDVKIEMKDGNEISATDVKIVNDSLSWTDEDTEKKSKTSLELIDKIVMKNHSIGGLEGFGFGLVGGAGITVLTTKASYGKFALDPSSSYSEIFLSWGIAGIIGGTTGLFIGHKYKYEFQSTEQSDSLKKRK